MERFERRMAALGPEGEEASPAVQRDLEALRASVTQLEALVRDFERALQGTDCEANTVDVLLQRARREIAETGQVSAATADALQSAVSTLSYAELHALIVGQGGSDASDASGAPDN